MSLNAWIGHYVYREDTNDMKWMPIETAPKDGTFIFLLGPSGYITTPYRVKVGRWLKDYRPYWIDHANNAFTNDGEPPTHWMPIIHIDYKTPIEHLELGLPFIPCNNNIFICQLCGSHLGNHNYKV